VDPFDIHLSVTGSYKLNVQEVMGSNIAPETGCHLCGRSKPSWKMVRLNRRGVRIQCP
jgi:hypothetical protein